MTAHDRITAIEAERRAAFQGNADHYRDKDDVLWLIDRCRKLQAVADTAREYLDCAAPPYEDPADTEQFDIDQIAIGRDDYFTAEKNLEQALAELEQDT